MISFSKYSKKQCVILFVYCLVNFTCASCISLQGPFYPMIAEKKGVTSSQYGFVFGAANLAMFIVNPLSAVLISKFGAVIISISGLFSLGIASILFGFVDKLDEKALFLGISILLRILEAVGLSMSRNSALAIVSCEFSDNVEVAFAFVQASFSSGVILGSLTGGVLFELGGFFLPFSVVGGFLLSLAFAVLFLPKDYSKEESKSDKEVCLNLLVLHPVILAILSVFGAFISLGFLSVTLEPHSRDFGLSPVQVGLLFLCNASAVCASFFILSKTFEKYESASMLVFWVSPLIIICGLLILGPAPYIGLNKSIFSLVIGLLFYGTGIGGEQIVGFSALNKGAKLAGLPKSMQTYGIISSMYTSSLGLGLFVGSILGGYLMEAFGFAWGSHVIILYHFTFCAGAILYSCLEKKRTKFDDLKISFNSQKTSYMNGN